MAQETSSDKIELDRRSFLAWAVAAMGSFIAIALGGAGTGYFLSPVFKKQKEDWVDIGPANSIPLGTPAKVEFAMRKRDAWATTVERGSAWVLTSDGRDFTVFDPRCTHLGCPFRWDDSKKQFLCPCHAGVFGADGNVVSGPPPRPLDRFEARVERGRLLIQPQGKEETA